MSYFVIVYNRSAGRLVELAEYDESDSQRALKERFAKELEARGRPELEVVLLGAASLDALKRTHSRYFKTRSELAGTG